MSAYYNEVDGFCCDVLRARIADGSLPDGVVDDRDVRTVQPSEIAHHEQIHLFAGIGGGALACRIAGVPDDFRLITAGVPCQPSSQVGKRLGSLDERWLWPEFFRLLRGLGSHYALVEQPPGIVSLNDGAEWLDILGTLAEVVPGFEGSRVSAADVGAFHERERIWLVACPAVADDHEQRWLAVRTELQGALGRFVARRDKVVDDTEGLGLHAWDLGSAPGETDRVGEWRRDAGDGYAPVGDAEHVGQPRDETGGREAQHGAEHARDELVDTASGGRGARRSVGVRRADGRREELGDTDSAGRAQRDASAVAADSRHVSGERGRVGVPGRASVQCQSDARGASAGNGEDEGEEIQRERRRRDAWDYGQLLRPWDDAVPVRGADGTVRFIPREAAEAGPQSPLWPVADGVPGRVARLRSIGNAWVPQAAVPALRVILEHARRSSVA